MSSFWRNFHHWLHRKLSKWQLSVQSVIKISSKWQHFRFSVKVMFMHCCCVFLHQSVDIHVDVECTLTLYLMNFSWYIKMQTFIDTGMAHIFEIIPRGTQFVHPAYSQCNWCWLPGDARSYGTNSHGIGLVLPSAAIAGLTLGSLLHPQQTHYAIKTLLLRQNDVILT